MKTTTQEATAARADIARFNADAANADDIAARHEAAAPTANFPRAAREQMAQAMRERAAQYRAQSDEWTARANPTNDTHPEEIHAPFKVEYGQVYDARGIVIASPARDDQHSATESDRNARRIAAALNAYYQGHGDALPMPDPAKRYTIAEIRAHNKAAGKHFFDAKTMKTYGSKVEGRVYQGPGGVFFITSEVIHPYGRQYKIRQYDPATGDVRTVPGSSPSQHLDLTQIRASNLAQGE